MHASVDFVGENNVDVGVGVSNGVIIVAIIPMVHDSIIVGDFGAFGVFGGPSNILMFSSYNAPIASTY
jgi:glutamate synthase domain-containing protein 3